MSYQQTVNECRTTAKIVNPNGRFDHGRHVDLSQMFEGAYPMIYLYPFEIDFPEGDDFIDDHTLLVGFFMQDNPANTTEQREAICHEMFNLAKAFLDKLKESKLVRIVGRPRGEPQYGQYQGTISGFALRFTYQNYTPCP